MPYINVVIQVVVVLSKRVPALRYIYPLNVFRHHHQVH